jgi:hypothetical protein
MGMAIDQTWRKKPTTTIDCFDIFVERLHLSRRTDPQDTTVLGEYAAVTQQTPRAPHCIHRQQMKVDECGITVRRRLFHQKTLKCNTLTGEIQVDIRRRRVFVLDRLLSI